RPATWAGRATADGSLFISTERHGQPERLEFLHQHVERLRNAGLGQVLALDDRLVDARPPGHVVALDGQDLLESVRCAVCFERPDLHLPEALTTELRLTRQRLLRDERVGSDGARVDL